MKRITMLFTVAALMAVMLMSMSASPASALVIGDKDHGNDHNTFFFDRDDDFFDFDRDGLVSFDLGDVENESGDIETENSLSIEGNNNKACVGQQQFGNTGNFTNQQGVLQPGGGGVFDDNDDNHNNGFFVRDEDNHRGNFFGFGRDHDDDFFGFDRDRDGNRVFFGDAQADDIEFSGPEVTFAPSNETSCEQDVEQAAAASSTF